MRAQALSSPPSSSKPPKPPADALFLTRRDAAALLGLNVQLVDRMINEEQLPAYRIGRRILIRRDELLKAVAESPVWKGVPRGER